MQSCRVRGCRRNGEEVVQIFKSNGNVQSCSDYRGIKLMSHEDVTLKTMTIWERVVEAGLRREVN